MCWLSHYDEHLDHIAKGGPTASDIQSLEPHHIQQYLCMVQSEHYSHHVADLHLSTIAQLLNVVWIGVREIFEV
jgi:hypothetical protein